MDSLLATLVMLLIYAISSWLQRKAQARQKEASGGNRGAAPPPRPNRPARAPAVPGPSLPRQAPAVDWQEELRRLLAGEPVEVPPPIATKPGPAHPPAPPVVLPSPPHPPLAVSPAPTVATELPGARLDGAIAAYEKAQRLHEEAGERLEQTIEHTKRHSVGVSHPGRAKVSEEIASAIALVRHPSSVRQAFVASVALGPPKAFDN